jgi:hypothetical protein
VPEFLLLLLVIFIPLALVFWIVRYILNSLAEKRYQKSKRAKPGEVEKKDGGWLDQTTPGNDTFAYMVRTYNGQVSRGVIVKFTPEFLYVSDYYKVPRWPHKRVPLTTGMIKNGDWLQKAKTYDLSGVGVSSFRIARREVTIAPGKDVPGYVIVMQYGERTVDLNYLQRYAGVFSGNKFCSWDEEAATALLMRFRQAIAHVRPEEGPKAAAEPPARPRDDAAMDDPF